MLRKETIIRKEMQRYLRSGLYIPVSALVLQKSLNFLILLFPSPSLPFPSLSLSGKYGDGSDVTTWKINFRCALNGLKDIIERKELEGPDCRVYQMLPSSSPGKQGMTPTVCICMKPYKLILLCAFSWAVTYT